MEIAIQLVLYQPEQRAFIPISGQRPSKRSPRRLYPQRTQWMSLVSRLSAFHVMASDSAMFTARGAVVQVFAPCQPVSVPAQTMVAAVRGGL